MKTKNQNKELCHVNEMKFNNYHSAVVELLKRQRLYPIDINDLNYGEFIENAIKLMQSHKEDLIISMCLFGRCIIVNGGPIFFLRKQYSTADIPEMVALIEKNVRLQPHLSILNQN